MKVAAFFAFAGLVGGCASQPTPPPVAHRVKVDASNVEDVQRAGYKLVDKDGDQLYCRTDSITGSRLQTRTVCLTRVELDQQLRATQQSMAPITTKQVGPAGH